MLLDYPFSPEGGRRLRMANRKNMQSWPNKPRFLFFYSSYLPSPLKANSLSLSSLRSL